MYSPILSDNDVDVDDDDDDAADDVTESKHTGNSSNVISGGRTANEDNNSPAADRSAESADRDTETVDHDDDDDDDDDDDFVSDCDYTISGSLEEKEQKALDLERSSGLAQSTQGETLEYIDSDERVDSATDTRSLTPVNEQLEMTLRIRGDDDGSPIAESTTSHDHHDASDKSDKDVENVLSFQINEDAGVTTAAHQHNVCDGENEICSEYEVEEAEVSEQEDDDVSFTDQEPHISTESKQNQEENGGELSSTNQDPTADLLNQDDGDTSRSDGVPRQTVAVEKVSEDQRVTTEAVSGLEQSELKQNDVATATVFAAVATADDDSNDVVYNQTVLLVETSQALVTSLRSSNPANPDDTAEDHYQMQVETLSADDRGEENEITFFEKDFVDGDETQNKQHNVQQEVDLLSSTTNVDPTTAKLNQDQNDDSTGSSRDRIQTVTSTVMLELSDPSSSDQTASVDIIATDQQSEIGVDKKVLDDLDQTLSKEQNAVDDFDHAAPKLDQNLSNLDLGETICSNDVEKDERSKKGENLQPEEKNLALDSGLHTSTDDQHKQKIEDQRAEDERLKSVCWDEVKPRTEASHLSLTTSTAAAAAADRADHSLTPGFMQVALMSNQPAPVIDNGERQLELASKSLNSWRSDEDEDKKNLLCLLDSRRRTEMDRDNWQLARRIEDDMSLVKNSELDDLENVQVSVKVR